MKKWVILILSLVLVSAGLLILPIEAQAATEYTEGIYTYTVTDGKATITKCDDSVSGKITIPSTLGGYPVTVIGNWAFYFKVNLTGVKIPEGVTDVENCAFLSCQNLTSITFPDSVTAIGSDTFHGCNNLTSVNLGNGVTSIGDGAFLHCYNLTSIRIPEGVTRMGKDMFEYCESLISITIPNSVTSIGEDAFYDCDNLTNVVYCGTAEQWGMIDIGDCNDDLLNAQRTYHSWDAGATTQEPTCKEEGTKTYTCTICRGTRTEPIDKSTTHTYDNDCDAVCNICSLNRVNTHKYKSDWSKDQSSHWYECYVCKDKKDVSAHTPGAAATETTAQTCTACGYIIQPALGHTHNYAQKWTMDESGHWHACDGCNEKKSESAHTPGAGPTETQAQTCAVCGYVIRAALGHTHKYVETWTTDEKGHWHTCSGCNQKNGEAAHTPGAAATATTPQTCTVCGYEITPALGASTTEPATTPIVSTTVPPESSAVPSTSSNIPSGEDDRDTAWITIAIVVVMVCAVVVAAASAVVTVLYVKKKK